jgi:hypothetical protein
VPVRPGPSPEQGRPHQRLDGRPDARLSNELGGRRSDSEDGAQDAQPQSVRGAQTADAADRSTLARRGWASLAARRSAGRGRHWTRGAAADGAATQTLGPELRRPTSTTYMATRTGNSSSTSAMRASRCCCGTGRLRPKTSLVFPSRVPYRIACVSGPSVPAPGPAITSGTPAGAGAARRRQSRARPDRDGRPDHERGQARRMRRWRCSEGTIHAC